MPLPSVSTPRRRNASQFSLCPLLVAVLLLWPASARATDYFVNDNSITNDVYCTAVGLDANLGTSPGAPKLTLSDTINDYNFVAGDRVFIDTGSYEMLNLEYLSVDGSGTAPSPIQIVGSPLPGGTRFLHTSGFSGTLLFQVNGNGATISYVQVKNITFDCSTGGGGAAAIGLRLVNAANCTVENCAFLNGTTWTSGPTTWYGSGVTVWGGAAGHNNTIRNCVFSGNREFGVFLGSDGTGAASSSTGNAIVNCTYYNNGANYDNAGNLSHAGTSTGTSVRNCTMVLENAATANNPKCIYVNATSQTGFTSDYNCLRATGAGMNVGMWGATEYADLLAWQGSPSAPDANSIASDPLFADPGTGDFHLKSQYGYVTFSGASPTLTMTWSRSATEHSPCIDAGSTVSPYDVFSGESEDNGNRVDIGAYGNTWQSSRSSYNGATNPGFPDNDWNAKANLPVSTPNNENNQWPAGLDQRISWNSHGNWVHGVPTSANDQFGRVRVTSASPNPQLDSTTTAYSVQVLASGTLNVTNGTAYTLTSSTTLTIAGTGTLNLSNGTVISTGTLSNSGSISQTGGTLEARGNFTSSGGYAGDAGTMRLAGGANQSFTTAAGDGAPAVVVANSGTTGDNTVSQSGNLTIGSTLTINAGALALGAGTRTVAGATTVSDGRLTQTAGTTSFTGAVTVGGGAADAHFEATGLTTLNFNAPGTDLTISGNGTFTSAGSGASRPTFGTSNATWAMQVSGAGSSCDVMGAVFDKLGDAGLTLGSGADIVNLNDADFLNGPGGAAGLSGQGVCYVRILSTNAGNAWIFRACRFEQAQATVQRSLWNESASTTVRVENAEGVKGRRIPPDPPVPDDGIGGEENDLDPLDSGGLSDRSDSPTSEGGITWVYARFRWRGGPALGGGNDDWNVAANWEDDGVFPSLVFPNATTHDVLIGAPDVVGNDCQLMSDVDVRDISIVTGGTLYGNASQLSVNGTAFKTTGGVFNAGTGTVRFAGSTTQTVIIIGGAGSFNNLTIDKTGGSATLGATLTVGATTLVRQGTFDLGAYTLTQNGALGVSDADALVATLSIGTGGKLAMGGASAMTVAAQGTLALSGSGEAVLGNAAHTVSGTLSLGNTGVLRLPDAASAILTVPGTFRAVPTSSSSKPTLTRVAGGTTNAFVVNLTGTVDIRGMNFSYAGPAGLGIGALATVGQLDGVSFGNGSAAAGGTHLTIARNAAQGAWTFTSIGCSFDATSPIVATMSGDNSGATVRKLTLSGWTLSGTTINDPSGTAGNVGDDEPNGRDLEFARQLDWVGKWRYRQNFTISSGGSARAQGTWWTIEINHSGLGANTLTSGDDIRIVYDNGGDWQQLPRANYNVSGTTGWNTATTRVEFQLVNALTASGAGSTDANYYLYYGASIADAASPPLAFTASQFSDSMDSSTIDGTRWPTVDDSKKVSTAFAPAAIPAGRTYVGRVTYTGQTAAQTACGYVLSRLVVLPTYPNTATDDCRFYYRWHISNNDNNKRETFYAMRRTGTSAIASATDASWTLFSSINNGTSNGAGGTNWASGETSVLAASNSGGNGLQVAYRLDTNNVSVGVDFAGGEVYDVFVDVYPTPASNTAVTITVPGTPNVQGVWTDPFNWSVAGSTTNFATPASTDDCVVNGGTYQPKLDTSPTVYSLKIGTSAASSLDLAANLYDLTTVAGLTLGASGTIDATGRTTRSITVGADLSIQEGTLVLPGGWAGGATAPLFQVQRDLVSSGTMTFVGDSDADINLRRHWTDIGGLQFSGVIRMRGPASGAGASTVSTTTAARVRRLDVSRESGSPYTVSIGAGSQAFAEMVNITSGELQVPSTATLTVDDVPGMASGGSEGVLRFEGTSAATNRLLTVSGGTLSVRQLGASATSNNIGTLTLGSGAINLTRMAGAKGDLIFDNSVTTPNAPSLVLNGGSLTVEGNWTVQGSSGGAAPTWSATAGKVVFGGSAGQVVTHVPAATPTFFNVEVGTGTNGPTVTLANDLVMNDLDVVRGTFRISGSGRTVRVTGGGTASISGPGILELDAASANKTYLRLASGTTLEIGVGGTLKTTATTVSSRATIMKDDAGAGYGINVSGTMDVNSLAIADLDATGVRVQSSGTLLGWTGVRFTAGAVGGVYLDVSLAGAGSLPPSMSFCQFDDMDPGPGTTPTNNVKSGGATTAHGSVVLTLWAGGLGGEPFEANDTFDLVDWGPAAAVVLNPGASESTYATITDAIVAAAADAAVDTIEVRDGAIREEVINLPAIGPNARKIILDGAVLRVPNGAAEPAVTGSGDNAGGEVFKNLVLVRELGGFQPILRNVGRVFHCTIVGYRGDGALVEVLGGNACTMQGCIVGDPLGVGGWGSAEFVSVENFGVGAFAATYTDFDRLTLNGLYDGTVNFPPAAQTNFNLDPLFVAYRPDPDPTTDPDIAMYDPHLQPGSPCVDYAPAPPVPVDTDFDRGLDFDPADLGADNPRRAIDARPDADFASWTNNAWPVIGSGIYDVGADELGPFTQSGKCQGTPLWANRAGAEPLIAADGPLSHSNPIAAFTYSVMYVVENLEPDATPVIRLMAYAMNDADNDGALDAKASLLLPATVQKVHHITVQNSGGLDRIYMVADTTDGDTIPDAILCVTYTPPPVGPTLAHLWGPTAPGGGAGTIGRLVRGQGSPGHLLFVRGDGYLHRMATDGTTPVASGSWLGTGQLDPPGALYDGKFDAEGGLFAGKFNNSVYVPVNAPTPATDESEILRIALTDGSIPNEKNCGTSDKNHFGGTAQAESFFVTAADQYVWRLHQDTLDWDTDDGGGSPRPWTWRGDLGAGYKTTGFASVFGSVDRHVRVAAGDRIFRFRRESTNSVGTLSADSDGAGDDWGPGRTFRGAISTPLIVFGGSSKATSPANGTHRGGKIAFGTDQGYCYFLSYIRDTDTFNTTAAEPINDAQAASSAFASQVYDGCAYPGFPYRIPGVRIVHITLVRSTSLVPARDVLVFTTDNGWMYGFLDPN